MENKVIDHLFRHQHGKMVSILTRVFGVEHLETIEDAIQDTFIRAIKTWRNKLPENPEAWLTTAAKNRTIDIFRSLKSQKQRGYNFHLAGASLQVSDLFLESEIADAQLRMIFTACHPILNSKEQIAFSLKTIAGFSPKEIATALMSSEETIKKRLQRAKKSIVGKEIKFEIPQGQELINRMDRVLEVIYLIFNEGFHSGKKEIIIRKELCGEALRLCKLLLAKKQLANPKLFALFGLLCFHSARLESKVNAENEIINLKDQDRSTWFYPLIALGNDAMVKALENNPALSSYHYEAAIASEHLRAANFESTNWEIILKWYKEWYWIQASPNTLLSIAIVHLQLDQFKEAQEVLMDIKPKELGHRSYLYFASLAEYYYLVKDARNALKNIDLALEQVNNKSEYQFLLKKRLSYLD